MDWCLPGSLAATDARIDGIDLGECANVLGVGYVRLSLGRMVVVEREVVIDLPDHRNRMQGIRYIISNIIHIL